MLRNDPKAKIVNGEIAAAEKIEDASAGPGGGKKYGPHRAV